jgi:hypothetical protein
VILVISVLTALFIGYRIGKWVYAARPIFSAHPDYGSARINEDRQEPLAINFELLLNSNVGAGVYQFHTDEQKLVTHLRRENE